MDAAEIKDKLPELCAALTALCILADDSLPRDWTNAATLLRKLLFDEVNREPIARMRVTGRPATAVLISAVLSSVCTSNCQEAAAESLALTSAFPDSCAVCTSAAQQMSFWEPMARLMQDHKRNADVKAHIADFIRNMLAKNEAIGVSMVNTPIIPALVSMARTCRRERQLEPCMGCLALLCRQQENWPVLHSVNILRVATDILGPPPPGYCLWEYWQYQLWDPANRSTSACKVVSEAAPLPPHGFLGVSMLAVPFTFNTSFVTKAHAAECLLQFLLSDQPQYVIMMRDCRVAYRLGCVLKQILEDEDESGTKGKKKGLSLTPAQEESVSAALECNKLVSRRAARTILGNMALVGENRDYLVDVPEELYSAKCLSVPPDEAVLLQHEFQNISDERLACELKIHGHLLRLPESRAQIIFCSES